MNINYEKQGGGRQLTEAECSVKEKKQTKTNRDGHTLGTENWPPWAWFFEMWLNLPQWLSYRRVNFPSNF